MYHPLETSVGDIDGSIICGNSCGICLGNIVSNNLENCFQLSHIKSLIMDDKDDPLSKS